MDPEPAGSRSSLRARLRRVDWPYELVYLVAVLAAAALALTLAGRRPGWSLGQTPPDPLLVQIYAAHFRHGDLFPVWSSSDAYGMGTPVLLFYQRTFFMVGGLVFIVLGGSLKATLLVTVAIFMVVGAYGMRKALGVVTDSRMLQVVGSIAFVLTNWAFSEWLIRADLAEFSAFMLVPWLLWWCLTLVRDRRFSWSIVPVMVALVWAHNTVALASIVVLSVSAVVFLVSYGLTGLRAVGRRLVVSVGVIGVILAPGVVAEIKMGRYYDPAKTIIQDNRAINSFTFPHPWAYVFDAPFHWLTGAGNPQEVPFGLNIQLDYGITALLIVGLITLLVVAARRWIRPGGSTGPQVNRAVVVVLAVSFIAYQLAQFRFTLPVWYAFWQLKVVGFPFRLNTLSVPLALLLGMVVADWYLRLFRTRQPAGWHWVPALLAGMWLATFVLFSPVTAHEPAPIAGAFPYAPFVPISSLTAPADATFRTSTAVPLFPEYLPVVTTGGKRKLAYAATLYQRLHLGHSEAASLSSVPCQVDQTSGSAFESLRITYAVTCAGATPLALPVSYNPFTTVSEVTAGGNRPVAVVHLPADPRIVVRVPASGKRTYLIELPTLRGIL
jgi:hypothetical protein